MFGSSFVVVLGIVLWLIFAFWPPIVAKRKGYSFILFLILSWFFSFIIGLILAYSVKDRNATKQSIADDKAAEKALERDEHLS